MSSLSCDGNVIEMTRQRLVDDLTACLQAGPVGGTSRLASRWASESPKCCSLTASRSCWLPVACYHWRAWCHLVAMVCIWKAWKACQGGVPGLRAHAEENKRWKRSDQHTPTADDC